MAQRAVGIVIKNGEVLLIRRVKHGEEYFVFPGGSIEQGETPEQTVVRELKEETGLDVQIAKFLFNLENQIEVYGGYHIGYPKEHYFLITNFHGKLELGGPEKIKMTGENQYHLEWHQLDNFKKLPKLYPAEAIKKLSNLTEQFT